MLDAPDRGISQKLNNNSHNKCKSKSPKTTRFQKFAVILEFAKKPEGGLKIPSVLMDLTDVTHLEHPYGELTVHMRACGS